MPRQHGLFAVVLRRPGTHKIALVGRSCSQRSGLTRSFACARDLAPISRQALLLGNLRLDRLDLTLDELFEHFGGHPGPALLEDQLEDRVVEQTFWLASHGVEHTLVLILLDQLSQPARFNHELERLGHLLQDIAEDVMIGEFTVYFGHSKLSVGDNVEQLGQEGPKRVNQHVRIHRLLLAYHCQSVVIALMLDRQVKVRQLLLRMRGSLGR